MPSIKVGDASGRRNPAAGQTVRCIDSEARQGSKLLQLKISMIKFYDDRPCTANKHIFLQLKHKYTAMKLQVKTVTK